MSRQQTLDVTVRCLLPRYIAKAQYLFQCLAIELRLEAVMKQGFLFRREIECFTVGYVIERFDADSVARQKQRPLTVVPDRNGEHAVEAGQHGWSFNGVELQQHLSISVRDELTTPLLQRPPQLAEVVDFPVVDNPKAPINCRHRHVAARGQIEDREAARAEGHAGPEIAARVVRPAMCERIALGQYLLLVDRVGLVPVYFAVNAAHES